MTRPFRLQAPTASESDLQGQILDYLAHEQARGRVVWYCRVNGGGTRLKGIWVWFYRLYLAGRKPISKGKADIEGMLPGGRYFALEVKKPGEVATPEQVAFLAAVAAAGGIAATVRHYDEVKAVFGGSDAGLSAVD